jgi:2-polyprenyl-6-methoxyphenol hydroxylase-like FAD-dependent oxidoreductase
VKEVLKDKHVVVVGAGPVGMMSAVKLSRAGIPVTVIEKVYQLYFP